MRVKCVRTSKETQYISVSQGQECSVVTMEGQGAIQALPEEMLIKIFSFLEQQDLPMAVLVCRAWREVGELPWLWHKEEVVLGKQQVHNIQVLGSRRLEHVKRVHILPKYRMNEAQAEAVFQEILEHKSIKELNISQSDLSKVSSETLAMVVNSMEQVNMFNAKLTSEQCEQLFHHMAAHTRLAVLSIGCVNISGVTPATLAAGLNRVSIARLCSTAITTTQLEALFTGMAQGSELKEVDLGHNKLTEVDTNVIAHAIKNMETVKLYDTHISRNQIESIIHNIGGKLRTLDICFCFYFCRCRIKRGFPI